MTENNQVPTFNLKAVVRETGLKPDTLRAWERRYGLPQPKRTGGGHRLYSQRDIDILIWLVARQKEGLSISRAVSMWKQLETSGQDPLQLDDSHVSVATPASPILSDGNAMIEMRQAWIAACLAFDEWRAERILSEAFAMFAPETVCFELLQKGLASMGEDWYQNQITPQQEHFASGLATRRLETLVSAAPAPTRPERLLIGCPATEEHTFSPLLLTVLLRRQGWNVVYLGADVPTLHLEKTIDAVKPNLVILIAQRLATAATLQQAAQLLYNEQTVLAFGGRIFALIPLLSRRIPGHFLGNAIDQAPKIIERLLSSATLTPMPEPLDPLYQVASDHFQDRLASIEAQVWQSVNSNGLVEPGLIDVISTISGNIVAALAFGDLDTLGSDIDWLEGLLTNHQMPDRALRIYLDAYEKAAKQILDDRGAVITNWLENLSRTE